MLVKTFTDPSIIKEYRKLRWGTFRKPHGLPLGSEYYEGEENGIYIGVFEDEKLIGGVFLIDRGNHNIQIHQMIVAKEKQGQRIGELLDKEAERVAREKGFNFIYAHARDHIAPFYKKCGYKLINKEDVPEGFSTASAPGVPHSFMRKEL